MVSDRKTKKNPLADTLVCILISTNSNFMLNISHSEFYSGILSYHLLLSHYYLLNNTSNLLEANLRTVLS